MTYAGVNVTQEDAFSDRVQERLDIGDEDAEAEWLLQLEDLLFSTAPSEQNKATGKKKPFDLPLMYAI